jgi:hypothetical protein
MTYGKLEPYILADDHLSSKYQTSTFSHWGQDFPSDSWRRTNQNLILPHYSARLKTEASVQLLSSDSF